MKTDQEKRSDFKRLLIPRLEKAVKSIKIIGNLSANQYGYTAGEVDKILDCLRLAVDGVESKFTKKPAPLLALDKTKADQ